MAIHNSKDHRLAILPLLFILLFNASLHAAGLYCFTKGFLLTRLVLDDTSSCDDKLLGYMGEDNCWFPKRYEKVVIVVIDALRFDFTVPQIGSDKVHHNVLTVLHEMVQNYPDHAFLSKFIADPPTTTLQRLKGLTTGSLPTFIDAGTNFAGTEIVEDNLILQLRRQNKSIAFLGDDTWTSLFPESFNKKISHPYGSLNVWDLHTVDNGIKEHIMPLLHPNKTEEWDVLIAHFLGLDHAGHWYGPNHEKFESKLVEMDIVVRNLIPKIPNDTLFVVMGDHGMDDKGNHGGDSKDEVEAAIWFYSPDKKLNTVNTSGVSLSKLSYQSISQIDFVPTLALLFGLPIPYNSLGFPIKELFPSLNQTYGGYLHATRLTHEQLSRYYHTYSSKGYTDFKIEGLLFSGNEMELEPEEAIQYYQKHQQEFLSISHKVWAKFDVTFMTLGIIILMLSLLCLYETQALLSDYCEHLTEISIFRMFSTGCILNFAWALSRLFCPTVCYNKMIALFAMCLGASASFYSQIKHIRKICDYKSNKNWPRRFACIFPLLHAFLFASNSYTIWEDHIVLYFVETTIFGMFVFVLLTAKSILWSQILAFFGLMMLSRTAAHFKTCREEQMPFCITTFVTSTTISKTDCTYLILQSIMAWYIPKVVKHQLQTQKHCANVDLLSRISHLILSASATYRWLEIIPEFKHEIIDNYIQVLKLFLARSILLISGGTIAWVNCSRLWTNKVNAAQNRTKAVKNQSMHLGDNDIALISIIPYYLLLSFVLKPMGSISMTILLAQTLILSRTMKDTNFAGSNIISISILSLLSYQHFFTTGHQATLSSIQWHAAFLPFTTLVYPFAPVLVLLNTFPSIIFAAIALPYLTLSDRIPVQMSKSQQIAFAVSLQMLYHAIVTISITIFAAYFRRHLMVWKIFAPRFMMGGIILVLTDIVSILFGFLYTSLAHNDYQHQYSLCK